MQIIVLGMHRSGTSVVARLLNMMGAYFGPEGSSIGANPENPKGFWERHTVVQTNETLFASCGSRWYTPQFFAVEQIEAETFHQLEARMIRFLLEVDAHRPWLLKDPRFSITLPVWRRTLEIPLTVLVYRDFREVGASLSKRNGFPLAYSLALCEYYNASALAVTQDLPRFIVSYNDLLQAPVPYTQQLFDWLSDQDTKRLTLPSSRELSAFVSQHLYRHRSVDLHPDVRLTQSQETLQAALSNLDEGVDPNVYLDRARQALLAFDDQDLPSQQELDSSRHSGSDLAVTDSLLALDTVPDPLRAELLELQGAIGEKDRLILNLRGQVQALATELGRVEQQLVQQTEELKQLGLLTELLRPIERQVLELQVVIEEKDRLILNLRGQLESLAVAKGAVEEKDRLILNLRGQLESLATERGRLEQALQQHRDAAKR